MKIKGSKKGAARPPSERKNLDVKPLPKRAGFEPIVATLKRRVIVKIAGRDGTGKTRLPLTGPLPLVVLQFDKGGLEGVAEQIAHLPPESAVFKQYAVPESGTKEDSVREYENFRTDWTWALQNARTIALDAEPEIWELFRAAEFGPTQPLPYQYRGVNAKYRKMIREAFDHDCNVFILSKMYPNYEETGSGGAFAKRTGEFGERGFKDLDFLVQCNLLAEREESSFKMTVGKCRQNGSLGGYVFEDDEITFDNLIAKMFPHLDVEDFRR